MDYSSALIGKEISTHATTWINLKDIVSDIGSHKKDKYCIIPLIWSS